MKESEAKTKLCPMSVCGAQGYCMASKCMAWEPEYMREDAEISENDDVPAGWFVARENVKSKSIRRYVPIDSGDCGMKTKEHGCSCSG